MKISLVILTLNEITGVKEVLPRIPKDACNEIFAVDGGSTDGTVEFLKANNVIVYPQAKRGRGAAFEVAFEKASGDSLLFFSPDGNEDPADIPKFRTFLDRGYDMVIATRMTKDARNEEDDQLLKFRKWANLTFNWLANVLWNRSGTFVTDSINGFRAITRSAWNKIAPDSSGYTIEYQCTVRSFKLGLKIAEFPTREGNRIDNREGAPAMKTGIAFLKMFFAELGASKR